MMDVRRHVIGKRSSVHFEFEISSLIGDDELEAVHESIAGILSVLEHGARDKKYQGRFLSEGYSTQIEHAENHLRRRGRADRQSGLDEILHAIARLTFAFRLTRLMAEVLKGAE
jgi:hypothetical protein